MCEKLKLFYIVTKMFYRAQYPIANLYCPKICEIRLLLNECLELVYDEIKLMTKDIIDKFNKYWFDIYRILAIVIGLDLRFKMKLIVYNFLRIYAYESSREIERV